MSRRERHNRGGKPKRVASPVSTGGGGSDFERHVGGYFLAYLLLGSSPPGCGDGAVREVRFQRLFEGEPLDDLIVVCESIEGERKHALQIKRDMVFSDVDPVFDETIRNCWATFTSPRFSNKLDRFGIVLGVYSKEVDEHYLRVLEWARVSATAADFWTRIAEHGLASESMRRFARLIRMKLTAVAAGTDADVGDETLWSFLRCMYVLRVDFHLESAISKDYAALLGALRHALPPGHERDSKGLFTHLINYAGAANRDAGSFTAITLIERLRNDGFRVSLPSTASAERANPLALPNLGPPFDEGQLLRSEPFVGRAEDLSWVERRLREGRARSVTALSGMGGIGKTALAAEVLYRLRQENQFPDGVAVILCQDRVDPDEVLHEVIARFHPQRQRAADAATADLGSIIRYQLEGKQTLVVLDDIGPDLGSRFAGIVRILRDAGATLLLTARQRLPADAVPVEANRSLDLLPFDDALDLFARFYGLNTAQELAPADLRSAERIIQALERHTLAVKLAGAYAADAHRSLERLAIELETDPLKPPDNETPRAVAIVFARSVRDLPAAAQHLFMALAAFATGTFSRPAAIDLARIVLEEDVAQDPTLDAEAVVDVLIRRALLTAEFHDPTRAASDHVPSLSGEVERLHLHALVRRYAEEQYAQLGESAQEKAAFAVALHYASFVLQADDASRVLDEANIIGALARAHTAGADELVAALCNGMQYTWRRRWQAEEMLRYLPWGVEAAERLAARSGQRDERLGAAAIALTYGVTLRRMGKLPEAVEVFQRNLVVRRGCEDPHGEGIVLAWLGDVAYQQGQLDQAQQYFVDALTLHRRIADQREEAATLVKLGHLELRKGHLEAAQQQLETALSIVRGTEDQQAVGAVLGNLAHVAEARGDVGKAAHLFGQTLAIYRAIGERHGEVEVLLGLGERDQSSGNLDAAHHHFTEALQLAEETRDGQLEGVALSHLGQVARQRGRMDEAQDLYERALEHAQEVHNRREEGAVSVCLGHVAYQRAQLEEAQQHYEWALGILQEVQDRRGEGSVLACLGSVASDRGLLEDAERYFQAALTIAREVRDRQGEGRSVGRLGHIALSRGHLKDAHRYLHQALLILEEVQDRKAEGVTLGDLGALAQAQRRLEEAQQYFERARVIHHEVQDRREEGIDLANLGVIAHQRHLPDQAQTYYMQALDLARATHDKRSQGMILRYLCQHAKEHQSLDEGRQYIVEALAIHREIRARREEGLDLAELADIEQARGDLAAAFSTYGASLEVLREARDLYSHTQVALDR